LTALSKNTSMFGDAGSKSKASNQGNYFGKSVPRVQKD
jgi:hypothetical protein